MSVASALLVAKVCRECGAEALRHRLYCLEVELFELARQGKIGFHDPAYAMLRDSVKNIIEFSRRISIARFLAIALFSLFLVRGRPVDAHMHEWHEALEQVESQAAREGIARLRERVLIEVSGSMLPVSKPVATLLSNVTSLRPAWLRFRSSALQFSLIVEAQARYFQRSPRSA